MKILRFACLLGALCLSHSAIAENILIVATSPVPPGKFKAVSEIGQKFGFTVEAKIAERVPAEQAAKLLENRDFIVFDAARSHMQDAVKGKLGKSLDGLKTPHLWMKDGGPAATGLPKEVAATLHAYYTNGGRTNYEGFFATQAAQQPSPHKPTLTPPNV